LIYSAAFVDHKLIVYKKSIFYGLAKLIVYFVYKISNLTVTQSIINSFLIKNVNLVKYINKKKRAKVLIYIKFRIWLEINSYKYVLYWKYTGLKKKQYKYAFVLISNIHIDTRVTFNGKSLYYVQLEKLIDSLSEIIFIIIKGQLIGLWSFDNESKFCLEFNNFDCAQRIANLRKKRNLFLWNDLQIPIGKNFLKVSRMRFKSGF
jgi:hypothetical protein